MCGSTSPCNCRCRRDCADGARQTCGIRHDDVVERGELAGICYGATNVVLVRRAVRGNVIAVAVLMNRYLAASVKTAADEVFEHSVRGLRGPGFHQEAGDTRLISRYAAEQFCDVDPAFEEACGRDAVSGTTKLQCVRPTNRNGTGGVGGGASCVAAAQNARRPWGAGELQFQIRVRTGTRRRVCQIAINDRRERILHSFGTCRVPLVYADRGVDSA